MPHSPKDFTIKDLLLEKLDDEELNADIDLLRKYFAEEKDFFNDLDTGDDREGIREKHMRKVHREKAMQAEKLRMKAERKFDRFQKSASAKVTFKVDRARIPTTVTYQEIVSARNHLKELKVKEFKELEKEVDEMVREAQLEKLEKKFTNAKLALERLEPQRIRKFKRKREAEERKKLKIAEAQTQKDKEAALNQYWIAINNNMKDPIVQDKVIKERKDKIKVVSQNLVKWSKKVEDIKARKLAQSDVRERKPRYRTFKTRSKFDSL